MAKAKPVRDDGIGTDQVSDSSRKAAEAAHALSAENRSAPDPASRTLWVSASVSTDDRGPAIDQVTPIFEQARADALRNPVTADGDGALLVDSLSDAATTAQARADSIRDAGGYVASTGEAAGTFDNQRLEGQVPDENLNLAPAPAEGERVVSDNSVAASGPAEVVYHDEVNQVPPTQV